MNRTQDVAPSFWTTSKLVPPFIRNYLRDHATAKTILSHYAKLPRETVTGELSEALEYLKKNGLSVFPYPFTKSYKRREIEVYSDPSLKLKYVILDGKKLYFKRKSSTRGIRRGFNGLRVEQDENSPHRYLTDQFKVEEGDILVDVGAAEGNLALSVIEKVKKVYLFETDDRWIEALKATFAPWKDKVEIINKFVCDKNDDRHVSLDQFFKSRERFNFLKIDAEGAEAAILGGGKELLASNFNCRVAVCCYHKPHDESKFRDFFEEQKYEVSFSKGYMIFTEPRTFFPPYLRRGVLRAVRQDLKTT